MRLDVTIALLVEGDDADAHLLVEGDDVDALLDVVQEHAPVVKDQEGVCRREQVEFHRHHVRRHVPELFGLRYRARLRDTLLSINARPPCSLT